MHEHGEVRGVGGAHGERHRDGPRGRYQQCEREGWTQMMKDQAEEGCSMFGFLLVNKVAGNFHFAPGKSFQQHNVHIHDLQPFGRKAVRTIWRSCVAVL